MSHAPILSEQLDDIQAMLTVGFGTLTVSRFWLLTIGDGCEHQARAWLSELAHSGLMVRAKHFAHRGPRAPIDEAVAIAFSFSGLAKLGCTETSNHPFPTPFHSGMGSVLRERLLRDSPRQQWRWSDGEEVAGRQTVHVLVVQLRSPERKPEMRAPDPDVFRTITMVENRPDSFRADGLYEPFGFRDGIAQPVIRGLREEDRAREEAGPLYEDRVVAPGEFVLGYANEYDELTYCPDVEQWAESGLATHPGGRFTLNGSYLAVRQIEQNVAIFKKLEAESPRLDGLKISKKLMGRSKRGLPLSWNRSRKRPISDSKADAFRYKVADANGFACPRGAHVRRVNPRDSLGVDVQSGIRASKLHRLLRRGRPYLEETENEPPREGMFFIACNADLERQFEFIHQRWVRNDRFGNLHHEDDPIVGSPKPPRAFTVPGLPSGDEVTLEALTRTLGGGYFFLPGIKALEFIVRDRARPAPRGPR